MRHRIINGTLLVIAITVSLYAIEGILLMTPPNTVAQIGRKFSSWDQRPKAQAILDFRREGIDTVGVYPMGSHPHAKNQYLFGGIGDTLTIACVENGYWSRYLSDRHGFNNPDAVWNSERSDIILLGDSFSHGYCVDSSEHFVAPLRDKYSVLNLGIAGADTLTEYAALKEYSAKRRARLVLFQFYGNDLENALGQWRGESILRRYIEDNDFRQNLVGKQAEINRTLRADFESRLRAEASEIPALTAFQAVTSFVFLRKTRHTLDLVRVKGSNLDACNSSFPVLFNAEIRELFTKVADRAESLSREIGAKLAFVYFPEWFEYACPGYSSRFLILDALLRERGIVLIDAREALSSYEPKEIFSIRGNSHYTGKANLAIGRMLAQKVESLIPSP